MSNARNISKADSRFVNATGDVHAAYALHGATFNEAGFNDVGNNRRIKLGTAYLPQSGSNVKITVYCGQGYNAVVNQYQEYEIHFRSSNGGSFITGSSGNFYANGWVKHTASGNVHDQLENVIVEQVDNQTYAFYLDPTGLMGNYSHYEVSAWRSDAWTHSGTVVTSISGNTISLDPNSVRSGGIRTTPYQPAFRASHGNDTKYTGTGTTIVYNNAIQNQGNFYNTSTGRFTAPIGGLYGFSWSYYTDPNVNTMTDLVKNSSGSHGRTESRINLGENSIVSSGLIMVHMSPQDYVEVKLTEASGGAHQLIGGGGNHYNFFNGYLIG